MSLGATMLPQAVVDSYRALKEGRVGAPNHIALLDALGLIKVGRKYITIVESGQRIAR